MSYGIYITHYYTSGAIRQMRPSDGFMGADDSHARMVFATREAAIEYLEGDPMNCLCVDADEGRWMRRGEYRLDAGEYQEPTYSVRPIPTSEG